MENPAHGVIHLSAIPPIYPPLFRSPQRTGIPGLRSSYDGEHAQVGNALGRRSSKRGGVLKCLETLILKRAVDPADEGKDYGKDKGSRTSSSIFASICVGKCAGIARPAEARRAPRPFSDNVYPASMIRLSSFIIRLDVGRRTFDVGRCPPPFSLTES